MSSSSFTRFCVLFDTDRERLENPTQIAVWLCMCDHVSGSRYGASSVFPSVGTIAKWTKCSESTVKRTMRRLEELGFLRVTQRFDGSRQTSNEYTLVSGVSDCTGGGCQIDREGAVNLTDLNKNQKNKNQKSKNLPLPSRGVPQDWGEHLDLAKRAVSALKAKSKPPSRGWLSITENRKTWIRSRMKSLGLTDATEFWRVIYQRFMRSHSSHSFLTLDLVMQPRKSDKVDHWTNLEEGAYEKPFTTERPKYADKGPIYEEGL